MLLPQQSPCHVVSTACRTTPACGDTTGRSSGRDQLPMALTSPVRNPIHVGIHQRPPQLHLQLAVLAAVHLRCPYLHHCHPCCRPCPGGSSNVGLFSLRGAPIGLRYQYRRKHWHTKSSVAQNSLPIFTSKRLDRQVACHDPRAPSWHTAWGSLCRYGIGKTKGWNPPDNIHALLGMHWQSSHLIGLTGFGGSGPSWCEGHPPCQLTFCGIKFPETSAVGEVKCEGMIECNWHQLAELPTSFVHKKFQLFQHRQALPSLYVTLVHLRGVILTHIWKRKS